MYEEKKYIDFIDHAETEMLALWERLVRTESPSRLKDGVDAVGIILSDFCTNRLGYYVRFTRSDTYGDCLCACSCPFEDYQDGIVLAAHMDTVHPVGTFQPTFSRDADYFYGPGVGDCKGGIVVSLYTAAALKEIGYADRPIKLVFAADEESGGPTGRSFYPVELPGTAFMLNAESGKRGEIVVGRKSSIIAEFKVHGTPAHIGYLSGKPRSAISQAVQIIHFLESKSDYDTLTFCCGTIQGGSGPTSVPGICDFTVNVRIKDASSIREAIDTLTDAAEKRFVEGVKTELKINGNRIPMSKREENLWLCDRFSRASEELGFGSFAPVFVGGGSDAAYASELGIPVICATGPVTDFQHTLKERALFSDLVRRVKIHTKLIVDSLSGREEGGDNS